MKRICAAFYLAVCCASAEQVDRQLSNAVAVHTATAVSASGRAVADCMTAGDWKDRVRRAAELDRAGRFVEAGELYAKLMNEARTFPATDPRRSEAFNSLGTHASYTGEYSKSVALYQQALQAFQDAGEGNDEKLSAIYANFAVVRRIQARYADAEAAVLRAIELNPSSPNCRNIAAEIYRVEGKLASAEDAARKALEVTDPAERDGKTHLLAAVLSDGGKFDEALQLYDRALAVHLNGRKVNAATTLANIAVLHIRRGDYASADAALTRALAIWEEAGVRTTVQVAGALNNLAQVRKLQRRYAEAEPLYRQALTTWDACVGRRHPEYGKGLSNLADYYHAVGNDRAAESTYRRAAEILSATLGNENEVTEKVVSRHVEILKALGRHTDAKRGANSFR